MPPFGLPILNALLRRSRARRAGLWHGERVCWWPPARHGGTRALCAATDADGTGGRLSKHFRLTDSFFYILSMQAACCCCSFIRCLVCLDDWEGLKGSVPGLCGHLDGSRLTQCFAQLESEDISRAWIACLHPAQIQAKGVYRNL